MPEYHAPDVRAALDEAFPFADWDPGAQSDTTVTLAPPTDGLTPAFLRQVAEAYRSALARGERPLKALTMQVGGDKFADTPYGEHPYRRIVERWVYLSRKAGYLPPTTRGSVA